MPHSLFREDGMFQVPPAKVQSRSPDYQKYHASSLGPYRVAMIKTGESME